MRPGRQRGWTRWTRILYAEVDPVALVALAEPGQLREPGSVAWPATQGRGWVRFDMPRGPLTPPRAVHFDLESWPITAWGCHRWAWTDRMLALGPAAIIFGLAPLWWAFPVREAVRIVAAAGGRVLGRAHAPLA